MRARLLLLFSLSIFSTNESSKDEESCQFLTDECALAWEIVKSSNAKLTRMDRESILEQTENQLLLQEILERTNRVENMLELVLEKIAHVEGKNSPAPMNLVQEEIFNRYDGSSFMLKVLPNGKGFYVSSFKTNWYAAKEHCEMNGTVLASIKNGEELAQLGNSLPNKFRNHYWLSGSNIGQPAERFVWLDGRRVDNSWWDKRDGEPDSYFTGRETCVRLHWAKLWDTYCTDSTYFICEKP
ncbi:C-type lectin domain family 4 member M-like isoform X2 [Neocloeon triangulifer]|uniref:C-type lectin domain family 4 member M-like isoform X2 n=1 Tax=Neocloeon triangulifer TaxID=2078957 RepID=UPI00286F3577|nr:C-type lectin domain family 4 member M-like isoform X2 [Neocloeon triangulifer]